MGSVCDSAATNVAAVNKLIQPGTKNGLPAGNLLEYKINGSNIIHIFDPPHLIKTVRNHLITKNLEHIVGIDERKYNSTGKVYWREKNKKKSTASWIDVKALYELDSKRMIKLLPKITDEHITPKKRKMKVNHATQVFSETFGRNLYFCSKRKQVPNNCVGTSVILLFFNDLFDSLNGGFTSGNNKLKAPITPESAHFKFWDYAMKMLNSMKFGPNLETGEANRSNVLKHFISALKGMRKLCERLFEMGVSTVSPRQTNQDGLENFFGCIRSYCCSNVVTARSFRSAFSTAIINNLTSKQSINGNCEDDLCKPLLHNLQAMFAVTDEILNAQNVTSDKLQQQITFDLLDLEEVQFSENEAKNCTAANIGNKLLKKSKCSDCCNSIRTEPIRLKGVVISQQSSSSDNDQVYPNTQFINTVKSMLSKIEKMLPSFCSEKNLKQKIVNYLVEEEEYKMAESGINRRLLYFS